MRRVTMAVLVAVCGLLCLGASSALASTKPGAVHIAGEAVVRAHENVTDSILSSSLTLCVLVAVAVFLGFATSAVAAVGKPVVEGVKATHITQSSATLEVQVDPEGVETSYEVWLECQDARAPNLTCESLTGSEQRWEGHLAGGSETQTVTADMTGLQPGYIYMYGAVATNAAGEGGYRENLFETCLSLDSCSTPPYERGVSLEGLAGLARAAEEGLERQAARQQAAKEQAEREAAAAKAEQPSEPAVSGPPLAATGSVSLTATSIAVQNDGMALVKLECLGSASCQGRLTLSAKIAATTKVKGRGRSKGVGGKGSTRTVTIGTESFSIMGEEMKTAEVNLNAAGRALLKADHGRCSASLEILELAPEAANTQTKGVQLVQEKPTRARLTLSGSKVTTSHPKDHPVNV